MLLYVNVLYDTLLNDSLRGSEGGREDPHWFLTKIDFQKKSLKSKQICKLTTNTRWY